jgi:hypothetical protein
MWSRCTAIYGDFVDHHGPRPATFICTEEIVYSNAKCSKCFTGKSILLTCLFAPEHILEISPVILKYATKHSHSEY